MRVQFGAFCVALATYGRFTYERLGVIVVIRVHRTRMRDQALLGPEAFEFECLNILNYFGLGIVNIGIIAKFLLSSLHLLF